MPTQTLENRIAIIEAELETLKRKMENKEATKPRGWRSVVGVFANDPEFEEAMRLGCEYRESLRPKDNEDNLW